MKKYLFIFSLIFTIVSNSGDCVAANNQIKDCTTMENCTQYMAIYGQRTSVFNTLNLSEEQLKFKDEIEQERFNALNKYIIKLDEEQTKLDTLKTQNASKTAILNQQQQIRQIGKDIAQINEKYDRKLKKCLTSEQRSKLHNIKRLQNREYKEALSNTKHKYLEDKKLRKFGEK